MSQMPIELEYNANHDRQPNYLWLGRPSAWLSVVIALICVYLTYSGNCLWWKQWRGQATLDESNIEVMNIAFGIIVCLVIGFLSALVSMIRTLRRGVRVRHAAILGGLFPIVYLFGYNRIASALGLHFHVW